MKKLTYEYQIGNIKNLIDMNHQLGRLYSLISSFLEELSVIFVKLNLFETLNSKSKLGEINEGQMVDQIRLNPSVNFIGLFKMMIVASNQSREYKVETVLDRGQKIRPQLNSEQQG
ncbi:unnamed protein product [Paramecium pentaurelia]|uniref:Uncharacterized protein n=1 Tax=Paramecium pentaurelia TaxID=43138 RepID=A0A8S1WUU9_9CILI|nr:unnamed protein product [Paramecium pentaurelia]